MLARKNLVAQAGECVDIVTGFRTGERIPGCDATQECGRRVQRYDVEQAHVEVFGDEDVRGRQPSVHYRLRVKELQRVANGPDDRECLIQWQCARVVEYEPQ